jgi:hypothetical protein
MLYLKVPRDVSRLLKLKMERRRPNIELKNSEDVQDALIEDYFRYNDLSRMEIGRTGIGPIRKISV